MTSSLSCWDASGNVVFDEAVKSLKITSSGSVPIDRIIFNVSDSSVNTRTIVQCYGYINNFNRNFAASALVFNGGFVCSLPPFVGVPGWSSGITGTLYYWVYNY